MKKEVEKPTPAPAPSTPPQPWFTVAIKVDERVQVGFDRPLTDVEREEYRRTRTTPPIRYMLAVPARRFFVLCPGSFRRDARGFIFTERAETLAASMDLDALHAAVRLLSGHALTRPGEPMHLADVRGGLPEEVWP